MGAFFNISQLNDCFGCGVCGVGCPTEAISMARNDDGFFRPIVDNEKCIDCGRCLELCSLENACNEGHNSPIAAYSAWSKDESTRSRSTSGGFIFELSRSLIGKGYKVLCVRFNCENNKAEYYIADNEEALLAGVGSKYAQATRFEILKEFDFSRKYLIVATPCTISSLRRYLPEAKRRNFVLVDFFCHGIPSYNLLDKYVENVKKQIGVVSDFKFRCDDFGWQESTTIKATGTAGTYLSPLSKGDAFFTMFLRDRCLAPCCYDSCRFKGLYSDADIRVGDFWGSKYSKSQKGINAVLVLTPMGQKAFDECNGIVVNNEETKDILSGQHSSRPNRAKSYDYVRNALKSQQSIDVIERNASVIDYIYGGYKEQIRRLFNKLKHATINNK